MSSQQGSPESSPPQSASVGPPASSRDNGDAVADPSVQNIGHPNPEPPVIYETQSPSQSASLPSAVSPDHGFEDWTRTEHSYQMEIRHKNQALHDSDSNIAALIEERDELAKEFETSQVRLRALLPENQRLKRENDELFNTVGTAKQAVEDFQRQILETQEEVLILRDNYIDRNKKFNDLKLELDAEKEQHAKTSRKAQAEMTLSKDTEERNQDLHRKVEMLINVIKARDAKISELKVEVQRAYDDMDQIRTQNRQLRESIASGTLSISPDLPFKSVRWSLDTVPENGRFVIDRRSLPRTPSRAHSRLSTNSKASSDQNSGRSVSGQSWRLDFADDTESVGGGGSDDGLSFVSINGKHSSPDLAGRLPEIIAQHRQQSLEALASDHGACAPTSAIRQGKEPQPASIFDSEGRFELKHARQSVVKAFIANQTSTDDTSSVRSSEVSPGYVERPLHSFQERSIVAEFQRLTLDDANMPSPGTLRKAVESVSRAFPGLQLCASRDSPKLRLMRGRPRANTAPVYSFSPLSHRGTSQVLIDHLPDDMLASPTDRPMALRTYCEHSTQTQAEVDASTAVTSQGTQTSAPPLNLSTLITTDVAPCTTLLLPDFMEEVEEASDASSDWGLGEWQSDLSDNGEGLFSPESETSATFAFVNGPSIQIAPANDLDISILIDAAEMLVHHPMRLYTIVEDEEDQPEVVLNDAVGNIQSPSSPTTAITTVEETERILALKRRIANAATQARSPSPPKPKCPHRPLVTTQPTSLLLMFSGWLCLLLFGPLLFKAVRVCYELGILGAVPWTEHGAFGFPGYPYDTAGTRMHAALWLWVQSLWQDLTLLNAT